MTGANNLDYLDRKVIISGDEVDRIEIDQVAYIHLKDGSVVRLDGDTLYGDSILGVSITPPEAP